MSTTITQLERQLSAAKTSQTVIDMLIQLAWALQREDTDRAFALCQQAQTQAREGEYKTQPYMTGLAASFAVMARLDYYKGNYDRALKMGIEALKLSEELGRQADQPRTLQTLGMIQEILGNLPEATHYYLQQLQIATDHNRRDEEALAYNRLAVVNAKLGDNDQAIVYFDRSLAIFRELDDKYNQGILYNNYCKQLRLLGNYAQSLEHGLVGLRLLKDVGSRYGQALIHGTLGATYQKLGQFDKALACFQHRLKLSDKLGNHVLSVEAVQNIGLLYQEQGHYETARDYLHEALMGAEEFEIKELIAEVHHALSEVHAALGDPAQALYHYKRYHQAEKSVYSDHNSTRIRALQIIHYTQQAKQEAETQKRLREEDRLYFERLSQVKDELINIASHDLKNPLASILTSTFMLKRRDLAGDADAAHYIDNIEQQVQRMRELVANLLDIAKLETGRAVVAQEVMLRPFLEHVLRDFQISASEKHIRIHFQYNVTVQTVEFDPVRIRQALDNLLSNAIKYSSEGQVVNLVAEQTETELVLKVVDTGLGIPQKDLLHIFDRFYRVDSEQHQSVEGSGLGLSITRAVVEQHGGRIWVESQPGEGSTFSFSLPLVHSSPMSTV